MLFLVLDHTNPIIIINAVIGLVIVMILIIEEPQNVNILRLIELSLKDAGKTGRIQQNNDAMLHLGLIISFVAVGAVGALIKLIWNFITAIPEMLGLIKDIWREILVKY